MRSTTMNAELKNILCKALKDLSILNENEDNVEAENASNLNMYEGGSDEFTIESELPYFPIATNCP